LPALRTGVIRELRPGYFQFSHTLVRDAIEDALPDERFGAARHVGAWWNRTSRVAFVLVGGDALPQARTIAFVGSIKWRDEQPFRRSDAAALAAARAAVPGADGDTLLLGVSRAGFDADAALDVRLTPEELLAAYRR
jgi:hypothetical protein